MSEPKMTSEEIWAEMAPILPALLKVKVKIDPEVVRRAFDFYRWSTVQDDSDDGTPRD